jgi:hypothetical protein
MKVALCFIISYKHILNKEDIWKKWINHNKDLFNVYFYYKDYSKIQSSWIQSHCIPNKYIFETSYYHVIPAYISIMNYAMNNSENQWFCLLTESCCPLISPKRFKYLFYNYYNKSIFSWKKAWWNVHLCKRANLRYLPTELHLGNDPWFIMKREDVISCLHYYKTKKDIIDLICKGGLANESLFAVMMYCSKKLNDVICSASHATDWSRMTSPTSPYLFLNWNQYDLNFIEKTLRENKYVMFIRKISPDFPDEILEKYIYEYSKETDKVLILQNPFWFHFILKLMVGSCIVLFLSIAYFDLYL